MSQATHAAALPPAPPEGTVAAAGPTCSKCSQPAVSLATWDWNESYNVCAEHQSLASQTAENLQRRVSFAPLPKFEQPLQRSERAQLKGEVYAAEAEIVDLKTRGLNLYNENTALTRQLQARTARLQETELQLRDKKAEVELLQEELEKRDAAAGDMHEELERLRTLVKLLPPESAESAERHRVGLNG